MLSKNNIEKLEAQGLHLTCNHKRCFIIKKPEILGNSIPNYSTIPAIILDNDGKTKSEISSDCPALMLWFLKNQYQLVCSNWVPGPGPGDFSLDFENEEAVVDFIESYYFGDNTYFKELLEYELNKR
ncbi:hypothetical protein [uncultured Tenacibaculum sp.]|uniref:hypothetical protein n=1 Tax=uncultured Tenacibaculum sp. TaxID=174713 RepID=UPI00262FE0A1|nr:hypothetical protein [uncultured Tenacibaculum sp.]